MEETAVSFAHLFCLHVDCMERGGHSVVTWIAWIVLVIILAIGLRGAWWSFYWNVACVQH